MQKRKLISVYAEHSSTGKRVTATGVVPGWNIALWWYEGVFEELLVLSTVANQVGQIGPKAILTLKKQSEVYPKWLEEKY